MAVVLVMTDGVRPDAIQQAHTLTFTRLMQEGAYTLSAQSVMPSITLPCHLSIFHSVPPQRHGILSNDFHPMARPLPGLYELIKQANKSSAAYYTWDALRDLCRPLTITRTYYVEQDYQDLTRTDAEVLAAALPH